MKKEIKGRAAVLVNDSTLKELKATIVPYNDAYDGSPNSLVLINSKVYKTYKDSSGITWYSRIQSGVIKGRDHIIRPTKRRVTYYEKGGD